MKTLVLFRPPEKMEASAAEAEGMGYRVLRVPATAPLEIQVPAWGRFVDGLREGSWDWVVFTSTVGVTIAARRLKASGWGSQERLKGVRLLAIGEATRAALESEGWEVQMVPKDTTSKGVYAALATVDLTGKGVAILRSAQGNPELVEAIESLGAKVLDVPLYRLLPPPDLEALDSFFEELRKGAVDIFVFTSSLTVHNILASARERRLEGTLRGAMVRGTVGAIGRPTAETLVSYGVRVDVVPPMASFGVLLRFIAGIAPP